MSQNYNPGPGVLPPSPFPIVQLSERDLGGPIPINYVTQPGVSLQAACFGHLEYEDTAFDTCLTNLLANGFRRFELDIYWDVNRRVWSFCPAAVPTTSVRAQSSAVASGLVSVIGNTSTLVSSLLSGTLSRRQLTSSTLSSSSSAAITIDGAPSATASTTSSIVNTTAPQATLVSTTGDHPEYQIGPYRCTSTIDVFAYSSILLSYIGKTQSDLGVNILTTVLNLHAAASASNPDSAAPIPSSFPQSSNLLSNIFRQNLTSYIYTPIQLQLDRANLNSSFYKVTETFRPAEDYYTTSKDVNDVVSTADGWPSQGYLTFVSLKRMLLQFGNIDPQMTDYNRTADAGTIFPEEYIQQNVINVTATPNGTITNGCFLGPGIESVSSSNASWATDADVAGFAYATTSGADINPTIALASNLTNCGISPILNVTLQNFTANENYTQYRNYSQASIWSWASGQPKNYSSANDADSENLFRCTVTNPSTGRWSVTDCSQRNFAACRGSRQPYNWTTTTYPITYSYAPQACPPAYVFAAPRTALENAFLTQALRSQRAINDGVGSTTGVFVDFNSIANAGCWTTGGANASCPYLTEVGDTIMNREIVVPSVAAVIVLVITALV